MRASLVFGVCLLSAASNAGCVAAYEDDEVLDPVAEATLFATCPDVSGTNIQRSLVITDPAILSRFSFKRTMDKIRTTAGIQTTETSAGIFQRWMRTFGASASPGDCDDARIDPSGYGITCPRSPEMKLAAVNPFPATAQVRFNPVGLFNRFDLAPSSGAHCGEYRIVYAMSSTDPNVSGRAFIIFEGLLPNPDPGAGITACLPVAQFWQQLTNDASVTSRADKLEQFYFTGGAVAGFEPIVHASHYGFASNAEAHTPGQVRTNFFVDFAEWHLREFKLRRSCTNVANPATCTLAFEHVQVKANPAEELFAGTNSKAGAFQSAFVNQVGALAATSESTIKLSINNQFNEFESVSQATNVVYASAANATIRGQIASKLTGLGSPLTVNDILHRATTQTCAGCHQASNGQALGGGLTWPSSLGFVQIDESSGLSPALTGTFLPHRKAVLEKFINARCSGVAVADDGLTIGGSPADAPN